MRTWRGNYSLTSNWKRKSSGSVDYPRKKLAMRRGAPSATRRSFTSRLAPPGPGPGSNPSYSDLRYGFRGMRRNAGFHRICDSHRRSRYRRRFDSIQRGQCAAVYVRFPSAIRDSWYGFPTGKTDSTQAEHYSDLREQNQSFSDLAGWSGFYSAGDQELTGTGEPERLTSVPVTGNFFALLGVQPAIGRSFTKEECQGKYSAPPAMLLSYSFWRRRFASDPNVVGRKLTLNNQPVTVVGVLPASFDFASVFAPGTPIDIFIPWPLKDKTKPPGNTMTIVGRLKPGATVGGRAG